MSQLQNPLLKQNRPFELFCRSTAESYSPEYALGGRERPRQTDSKSSIFLGPGILQLAHVRVLFWVLLLFGPFFSVEARDQMEVGGDLIHVASSFQTIDYLTSYSHAGELVWEVPFNSQIISWQIQDPSLFVFSRTRDGLVFFLSCLESDTGKVLWERSIHAPNVGF